MWKVQIRGDIHDEQKAYELSVILETNTHGQRSWGWGSDEKIILFGTGIDSNDLNRKTVERIQFALSTAEKLKDILNESE